VAAKLKAAGVRVDVDSRSEKVNAKIRDAQLQKIPYMLVVGDREAAEGQISVRNRKQGDLGAKNVDEFVAGLKTLIETRSIAE